MGSSGSGRFSDYPGSAATPAPGGGGGMQGGSSGVNRCRQAFQVVLEDVGNCDYFSRFQNLPTTGSALQISFVGGRVFALDDNGVKVGALPTAYNYLVACLQAGNNYVGVITNSVVTPVPSIAADFAAV